MIEQTFFIHPFFVVLFLYGILIFSALTFLIGELRIIICIVFSILFLFFSIYTYTRSFTNDDFNTAISETANSYVNKNNVKCINVNDIEIPFVDNRDMDIDGVSVRTIFDKEIKQDSIAYVYVIEHKELFFNGSHVRYGRSFVQITNYPVPYYEMQATISESLRAKKRYEG